MSDPEMGAAAAQGTVRSQPGAFGYGGVEAGSRGAEDASKSPRPPAATLARATAAAGIALLLVATGAAVLVWWAVHFHPDDEQTWMVPVGLVMFGTPIVAWFSVFASDFTRGFERRKAVGSSELAGRGTTLPSSSAAAFTASAPARDAAGTDGVDVKPHG